MPCRLTAILLLCAAAATLAGPPTEQDARRWVEDLASEQVEVREAADQRLRGLGREWKPFLEGRLASSEDPEVRARLRRLLAAFGVLRWETDVESALAEARRLKRPVLAFSTPGGPGDFA